MPDVLNALVAFVAEHRRCGDLDGGRDDGYVWLQCSCGGLIMQPANDKPPRQTGRFLAGLTVPAQRLPTVASECQAER